MCGTVGNDSQKDLNSINYQFDLDAYKLQSQESNKHVKYLVIHTQVLTITLSLNCKDKPIVFFLHSRVRTAELSMMLFLVAESSIRPLLGFNSLINILVC